MVDSFMSLVQVGVDWVLYLLIITSFLCVGVFVERWIYFRRRRGDLDELKEEMMRALNGQGDMDKLAESYLKRPSVPARMCGVALQNRNRSPEAVQELTDSQSLIERKGLERYLGFLGTVGANAPFVGLFGTVLGIVKAFRDLSTAKIAGPQVVMAGISEALVATAVGLMVAIPAVVVYNYYRSRVKRILADGEVLTKIALSYQLDRFLGAQAEPENEPNGTGSNEIAQKAFGKATA